MPRGHWLSTLRLKIITAAFRFPAPPPRPSFPVTPDPFQFPFPIDNNVVQTRTRPLHYGGQYSAHQDHLWWRVPRKNICLWREKCNSHFGGRHQTHHHQHQQACDQDTIHCRHQSAMPKQREWLSKTDVAHPNGGERPFEESNGSGQKKWKNVGEKRLAIGTNTDGPPGQTVSVLLGGVSGWNRENFVVWGKRGFGFWIDYDVVVVWLSRSWPFLCLMFWCLIVVVVVVVVYLFLQIRLYLGTFHHCCQWFKSDNIRSIWTWKHPRIPWKYTNIGPSFESYETRCEKREG